MCVYTCTYMCACVYMFKGLPWKRGKVAGRSMCVRELRCTRVCMYVKYVYLVCALARYVCTYVRTYVMYACKRYSRRAYACALAGESARRPEPRAGGGRRARGAVEPRHLRALARRAGPPGRRGLPAPAMARGVLARIVRRVVPAHVRTYACMHARVRACG